MPKGSSRPLKAPANSVTRTGTWRPHRAPTTGCGRWLPRAAGWTAAAPPSGSLLGGALDVPRRDRRSLTPEGRQGQGGRPGPRGPSREAAMTAEPTARPSSTTAPRRGTTCAAASTPRTSTPATCRSASSAPGTAGWVLLAGLGVAAVISGDYAGLELRPGRGRLRRAAHRRRAHGGHVRGHGARAGRARLGAADRRRRLHLRPPRARARGAATRPASRCSSSTPSPRPPSPPSSAPTSSPSACSASPTAGGSTSPSTRCSSACTCSGVGEALKVMLAVAAVAVARPGASTWSARSRAFDSGEPARHRPHRRRRRLGLPAVRAARRLGGVPVRHLVLPRRRERAAGRRGGPRPRPRHAARDRRGDGPARRPRRPDAGVHPGRRRFGGDVGQSGNPPVDALEAAGSVRVAHRRGQLRRAVRAGRQLLLDHLRLLAADVRALARRLPAARAVGDQRPQGAGARAARARAPSASSCR